MLVKQRMHKELADELYIAEKQHNTIEQLSSRFPEMTIADAYTIQLHNMERFLKEGRNIVGKKIGLTSYAMQKSLGVDQPDFGILYDDMDVTQARVIYTNRVLQPRVEGELAFVLKKTLTGTVTADEVLEATDYIVPAIEVVASRIRDWKLTIVDTIADNASSGMYLLSDNRIDPKLVAYNEIELTLIKNGQKVNSGFASAVMGNPANAVAWLSACLSEFGVSLNAGDVILSGALSAAVPASAGDRFVCDFGLFGRVSVCFE